MLSIEVTKNVCSQKRWKSESSLRLSVKPLLPLPAEVQRGLHSFLLVHLRLNNVDSKFGN